MCDIWIRTRRRVPGLPHASAVAGSLLPLLAVPASLGEFVADPDWRRHLQQLAPMTAGLAVQTTVKVDDQLTGPWQGLGVVAG